MVDIPGAPITDAEEEDQFHVIRVEQLPDHIDLLLTSLQEVADGVLQLLMVIMPPGSAKSTYCSVVFPAWLMAVYPRTQVILASYGSELARKHGRRARQLVKSDSFRILFPEIELSAESSAADEWALNTGSEYMAGGLLSGLTGNRADIGICDDPIKGRLEAESETIRERTKDAIRDDFESRVKPVAIDPAKRKGPRGARIMITTRWHEDDPAGAILPEGWSGESGDIRCRDGRTWRVICIPAEADRQDDPLGRHVGEYIWPEWFPPEHWAPFKRNARTWSSLYQGKPAPSEGAYFKDEWIREVEKLPDLQTLEIYGGSDYAVTKGGGDYTVHAVVGVDPQERIYLLDIWRAQESSDAWVTAFCDLVLKWKPLGWAEETGQIKAGVGPFLEQEMRRRRARVYREQFPTRGDKAVRAQSIRGRMAMDGLYVPAGAPWLPTLISELLTFPVGVNDDQADALGLIGQILDKMRPGREPPPEEKKPEPKGIMDMSFQQLLDRHGPGRVSDGYS